MDRIEIVARAMARYHLGRQTFASALNPELIAKISKGAEDKLWPALVEEAKAVLAALDDAAAPKDDVVAPKAVDRSDETLPEPTAVERQTAVRSEAADEFVRVGDEKGEGVSCTGEKIADMNRSGGDSDLSRDLPIAWAEQQHGDRWRQVAGTGPSTGFDRPWQLSVFRPGTARQHPVRTPI